MTNTEDFRGRMEGESVHLLHSKEFERKNEKRIQLGRLSWDMGKYIVYTNNLKSFEMNCEYHGMFEWVVIGKGGFKFSYALA